MNASTLPLIENCKHCGRDVSRGSGLFENRIPDLNDFLTKLDDGVLFPIGDFVCEECDNNSLTGNG